MLAVYRSEIRPVHLWPLSGAERWRVDLVFLSGLIGLIPMLMPNVGFKRANMIYLLGFYPIFAFIMLNGGMLGLATVDTTDWGGLLVTLVVAITGIVASLPLGILLAWGGARIYRLCGHYASVSSRYFAVCR